MLAYMQVGRIFTRLMVGCKQACSLGAGAGGALGCCLVGVLLGAGDGACAFSRD